MEGPSKKKNSKKKLLQCVGSSHFYQDRGLSEINALKIRDMFGITSGVAENKGYRIFLFKIDGCSKFLKRLVEKYQNYLQMTDM